MGKMLIHLCVVFLLKQTKSVDKRKYPETRTAAEAALLNLPAYVKYRKDWNRKKNNM